MNLLARLRSFVAALVGRRGVEREMDQEWQFHLDTRTEALVGEGLSHEEAARRARREFGDTLRWREQAREARGLGLLQDAVADLRYAARSLRQARAFTVTAIVTLTLAVGLNTGVFSIINGTLLRPWPVPDPDEVVLMFKETDPGRWARGLSPAEFRFLQTEVSAIELAASAQSVQSLRIQHAGIDDTVPARLVSGNYFATLRIAVALGRGLRPDDDDLAAPAAVAVIGDRLWRERFGQAADILGRTIRLNDVLFEIVGVAAAGATDDPRMGVPAVWVPLASYPRLMPDTEFHRGFLTDPGFCCVNLVGRSAGERHRASEAAAIALAISRFSPAGVPSRVRVTGTALISQPGHDPQAVPAVMLGVAWVIVVLLVACANLGNLQLARAMSRRRELAVRLALGAGRARIVRQLLTEGLLIAAVASVTSLATAYLLIVTIARLMPRAPGDDLASLASPDLRVFAFAWLLATLAMLVAGIGPALAATRTIVVTGPASPDRRVRLRSAFLAVQVALSVILLVGAALLGRGVMRSMTLVPDALRDLVRVQVSIPDAPDAAGERLSSSDSSGGFGYFFGSDVTGWQRLYETARERLGTERQHQLAVAGLAGQFAIQADPNGAGTRRAWVRAVSPEFFPLLDVRLLSGTLADAARDPHDVVASESLARTLWPNESALGRTVLLEDEPRRVVGVVADVHWFDNADPGPTLYVPGYGMLLARNDPVVLDTVRAAAADLAPDARVSFFAASQGFPAGYMIASRVAAALGLISLGMATAGTFGVLLYLVGQRSREIAVRMALGARVPHVARLVTAEALGALAAGAAAGLVVSALAAPVLRAYLLGLGPYDPIAYLAAVAILALAGLAASVVPIRRAAATDPALTLRQE